MGGKMKRSGIGLSVLVLTLFGAGCAFNRASVARLSIPELQTEGLKRAEYSVLGPASAQGCATYVGLWPIPVFWVQSDGSFGRAFTTDADGIAREAALSKATLSVPDADGLMAPRFEEEGNVVVPWYKSACVTVKGKAIQIKTDAALLSKN